MKADYINPHENRWVANDFKGMVGEMIVVDDRKFLIGSVGTARGELTLYGLWVGTPDRDRRVWPNMMWVALNWTDDAGIGGDE